MRGRINRKSVLSLSATIFVVASLFVTAGGVLPEAQAQTFEFVFASGLDRGTAGKVNTFGIDHNDQSPGGGIMEWQSSVKRTGDGAYHFVGGTIQSEKEILGSKIFGGLEVWQGGAFSFTSFPNAGLTPAWIMAAVPTDGVLGADHKPVGAIAPSGKLRLLDSQNTLNFAETAAPLTLSKWYYFVIHGRNGANKTQELYLYDGDTGRLLETLQATWTVDGTYIGRAVKWGFSKSGNTTGVEFYVDDLFFARGDVNPGPVRVVPKAPVATVSDGGFSPVGGPTNHEAIDEFPTDGDTTYTKNNAGSTAQHQVEFSLSAATPAATDTVYAVQSIILPRHLGSGVTTHAGVKVGTAQSTSQLTMTSAYNARRVVHTSNPATGLSWTPADVDTFSGVVKDADSSAREFRVTNAWWDVVYKMNFIPTLSVDLTANPTAGIAPLLDVDLTADVSGTAIGTIRYQFDCTDDGLFEIDVTVPDDPYTALDACDYPIAGTYTARVVASREGLTATDTATVTVDPLTLSVTLSADPANGSEPLSGVDLTADVAGSASGDIRYRFDCTDDGIFEADTTNALDPYTAIDLCNYAAAGIYTARALVDRQGLTATNTATITVDAAPTLSVTLAADPSTGLAPLLGMDLTADVAGTATGDIRYRFDCTDDGGFEVDVTNQIDPYTAVDACDYLVPGTYTARVTVDRGGLSATNTVTITVDPAP